VTEAVPLGFPPVENPDPVQVVAYVEFQEIILDEPV
jgi:hypothetical protein